MSNKSDYSDDEDYEVLEIPKMKKTMTAAELLTQVFPRKLIDQAKEKLGDRKVSAEGLVSEVFKTFQENLDKDTEERLIKSYW